LLLWIREEYEAFGSSLHPTAAVKLARGDLGVEAGEYAFVVQQWSFNGQHSDRRLAFKAARIESPYCLDDVESESLVDAAVLHGKPWDNAANLIADYDAFLEAVQRCDQELFDTYDAEKGDFEAVNEHRCNVQEKSARGFAERRIRMFEERLEQFQMRNAERMIPATLGLIRKEKSDLEVKMKKIDTQRQVDATSSDLFAGLILVE
jgi:hypothetical protein